MVAQAKVILVIEKELCRHKIRARVDLGLEVVPVGFPPLFARDVPLGKAGDPSAETAHFLDEPHELMRVFKSAFRGGVHGGGFRRVAAQRQNIAHAPRARFLQEGAQLACGQTRACQVAYRGQPVLALNSVHNPQRLLPRAPAGPECDRAKVGLQFHERREGFLQKRGVSLVGFRREKLERNHRLAFARFGGVDVADKLRRRGLFIAHDAGTIPRGCEENNINKAIAALKDVEGQPEYEIIVVDGGPDAATLKNIKDESIIKLVSAPGRAKQMNAGAAIAAREVLLFLHADTTLPAGAFEYIADALRDKYINAGAFRLSIDTKNIFLKFIEFTANIRTNIFRMPYGD